MQATTLKPITSAAPLVHDELGDADSVVTASPTYDDWVDDEAYRELFVSVIELAIKDYEFLRRIRQRDHLTPSERKKLRGLTEDGEPEEFFASRWFEDICGMIGVEPAVIRERLEVIAA